MAAPPLLSLQALVEKGKVVETRGKELDDLVTKTGLQAALDLARAELTRDMAWHGPGTPDEPKLCNVVKLIYETSAKHAAAKQGMHARYTRTGRKQAAGFCMPDGKITPRRSDLWGPKGFIKYSPSEIDKRLTVEADESVCQELLRPGSDLYFTTAAQIAGKEKPRATANKKQTALGKAILQRRKVVATRAAEELGTALAKDQSRMAPKTINEHMSRFVTLVINDAIKLDMGEMPKGLANKYYETTARVYLRLMTAERRQFWANQEAEAIRLVEQGLATPLPIVVPPPAPAPPVLPPPTAATNTMVISGTTKPQIIGACDDDATTSASSSMTDDEGSTHDGAPSRAMAPKHSLIIEGPNTTNNKKQRLEESFGTSGNTGFVVLADEEDSATTTSTTAAYQTELEPMEQVIKIHDAATLTTFLMGIRQGVAAIVNDQEDKAENKNYLGLNTGERGFEKWYLNVNKQANQDHYSQVVYRQSQDGKVEVISFCFVAVEESEDGSGRVEHFIDAYGTKRAYRNKGHGTRVMLAAMKAVASDGVKVMYAKVAPDNHESKACLQSVATKRMKWTYHEQPYPADNRYTLITMAQKEETSG